MCFTASLLILFPPNIFRYRGHRPVGRGRADPGHVRQDDRVSPGRPRLHRRGLQTPRADEQDHRGQIRRDETHGHGHRQIHEGPEREVPRHTAVSGPDRSGGGERGESGAGGAEAGGVLQEAGGEIQAVGEEMMMEMKDFDICLLIME